MTITFLGTSAANAYPLAYCRCDNCERARELGGPSLRRRSSVLVNDDLLIDLGPDIITGSFLAGCSLANVRYCLQTHSHSDHLDPAHFEPRTPEWGVVDVPRLHFYASPATARRAAEHSEGFYDSGDILDPKVSERLDLEIHQLEALQTLAIGRYEVTAFAANHDPAVDPVMSRNSSVPESALKALSRTTDHCTRPQMICDVVRPRNVRIVFFGGIGAGHRLI